MSDAMTPYEEKVHAAAGLVFRIGIWLPPWNLFWWLVGITIIVPWYLIRSRDNRYLLAIIIALLPGTMLTEVLLFPWLFKARGLQRAREAAEHEKYERHDRRRKEAHDWMEARFREQGFDAFLREDLRRIPAFHEMPAFTCNLAPSQVEAYQRFYAEAVRAFPDLTPYDICGLAHPLEPLDRAWAETNGISEWAEEVFVPCKKCGTRVSQGWHFGEWSKQQALQFANVTTLCFGELGVNRRHLSGIHCAECIKKFEESAETDA